MTELTAIKAALGILHLPSSVRHVRSEPLPDGIEPLLRIAGGDEQLTVALAERVERPVSVVRDACIFYIEQVLLSPEADCYRVLGATPSTPAAELRRNMALLMSFLHPDKHLSGERAVLSGRVTQAWDILRNPDRKAAYDAALASGPGAAHRAPAGPAAMHRAAPLRGGAGRPHGRVHENFLLRALRFFQVRGRP